MNRLAPFNGMRYAHKTVRAEAEAMEGAAGELGSLADEKAEQLAERFAFFSAIMRGHWNGEEEVLWPALEAQVPQVTTAYTLDHNAEYDVFESIEKLLASYRAAQSGEERAALGHRLQRQFIALNTAITNHSRKEDAHIIPLIEERFSPQQQGELSDRMVALLPQQLMGRIAVTVMRALDDDEREDYLRIMMAKMPPQAFGPLARALQANIAPEAWATLAARVPEAGQAAA
jgi:hemerythrin-like domain-containing protein